MEKGSKMVVTRAWRKEEAGVIYCLMSTEFPFGIVKKFRSWMVVIAVQYVNVFNANELYVQKGEYGKIHVYFISVIKKFV